MPLSDLVIDPGATIHQAMQQLDRGGRRILLILEPDGRLEGVLTDGDIRRFILKNGDLRASITEVFTRQPITLPVAERHRASEVMLERRIDAIPLVDTEGRVTDVVFWNTLSGEHPAAAESAPLALPVVIMAGGQGSRLYPYTKILPKPLIPIGDTPIVERILDEFHRFGCDEFFLTVNYKKNMIKSYFGELDAPYRVHFVEEPRPTGTGGSLALVREQLDRTFIVSNCDILIKADYAAIVVHHREAGNAVTLVTSVKHFRIPYGVVHLNDRGGIGRFEEKPESVHLVNTGMYVMEPVVFERLPPREFFHLPELVEACMQAGLRVGVFPVSEDAWMDMGQFDEMDKMMTRLETTP